MEERMKVNYFLIALFFVTPFLFAASQAGDRLVLIRKGTAPSIAVLEDLAVKPHFKGESWVLASATSQTVDLIRQKGFQLEVVDDDPWSEPYYLLMSSAQNVPFDLPGSFRIIATVPEGLIVKGPVEGVKTIVDQGVRGVRIHDKQLPLISGERGQFVGGKLQGVDEIVQSTVDQVSDSMITEYITRLVDFQTRYSCTDSVEASGQWMFDKFLELGYTDVSFDSFPINTWVPCDTQRNVVAVKPGTINPNDVIVVGGHYDSYARTYPGCDPDTLAPGADDDASGTVATIEAARVLFEVDTDKTIIFIPFGAEEQWMWGSYHFAEEAYNQGMNIVLMINLDMVANLNDSYWDLELWGDAASMPYVELVAEMATTYTDLIPLVNEGLYPGDAIPFWEYGYRAVYAAEADDSPHYHECTDIVENISIPYLTDVTEMTVATILYFSETPSMPSGFDVVNVGDGMSLYLSWDENSENDLAGYNIYYGTQPGIYDSLKTVTSAGDTLQGLLEGTTYYLAISAFDTDSNESFLTGEVEITASSVPMTPVGLESSSFDNRIVLEWESNQGELDLSGYNLYRWEVGDTPDTSWRAYVPAPTTNFTDDTAEAHILYGYYVTAVDNQIPLNESDPSEPVYGRLTTHDMGILVVDHTRDGSGGFLSPTDEAVDTFYSDLLGNYNVGSLWDVSDSVAVDRYLMDYDTGLYSVVLWHSDVRYAQMAGSDTTTIRKYLDGGGNLWLSGWMLLALLTGNSEEYYDFAGYEFVPRYVGIDSALTTSTADQDFIGAQSLMGGFPSVEIDSAKVFPMGALYSVEALLPPFSGSSPLYAYVSSDSASSEFHGLPVGVISNSTDYGLVFTDFPLYFMDQSGAEGLVDAVMELFGEPVSVGGDGEIVNLPKVFALSQNYPNPFNPSTTIRYDVPVEAGGGGVGETGSVPVRLVIYDVRGRLVRVLVDREREPGRYQVHWNGRDDLGRSASSGVYLYRIEAGDFVSTKKMVLVR
jgi:hypothetical protein